MNMVKVFIKGQEDKELSSFLRYYPTRIKNVGIDGVFDRQTIFDFKDGCNQPQVAQFVAKELVRKFGRKIGKVVFSCVPASSQERNEERNKAFSALVCKLSGAIDGFSHVKVNGERSAVHGTKMKKEVRAKRLEERNTIEVDASFFKNKIVCVWDDVVTTGTSFCAYAAQLESAGAHVTNGIFLGKTSYRYWNKENLAGRQQPPLLGIALSMLHRGNTSRSGFQMLCLMLMGRASEISYPALPLDLT